MSGRVQAALLSILVLCSLDASGNCAPWATTFSGQFRTTAWDVAVDGASVWVATGYGVQLIEDGSVVASIALPGVTRVVNVAPGGGTAYAGSGSTVYILQRSGLSLIRTGSVPLFGTVNDMELVGSVLFAATSNGIAYFDVATPTIVRPLNSSSLNVSSLAAAGGRLYAADGDFSVEIYSVTIPSLPQQVNALTTQLRATAVHATAGETVYVSDRFGQATDVFFGTSRVAQRLVGATSFAPYLGQTHFVAGPDRTVRLVDFSSTEGVELFAAELPATDGSDNTIHAMALSGSTLFVAAGDIGLIEIDVSVLASPYPQVSYSGTATTSVQVAGDRAYFSTGAGRIFERTINPSGISLQDARNWDAGAGSVVRDHRDNGLLTTAANRATVWALVSATPVAAVTVNFPDAVVDAVMADNHLVALLADGSVWQAPSGSTTPQKVTLPIMSMLARSGSAIALAEVRESDERTVVHHFAGGILTGEPQRVTIDGAAAGSLALDTTRAAVFTFNGIIVIDLASGSSRSIPGSDVIIPRQLSFAGDDLLVLDAQRLLVFANARTLLRDHRLPSTASALGVADSLAVLSTSRGTAALRYLTQLPVPSSVFVNAFYRELVAGRDRAYLFDDERIDVYATTVPTRLQLVATIPAAGTIDLAASDEALYTLAANGLLTAWSRNGGELAHASISEGFDSQPLSVFVAGKAVWASLATGCSGSGCAARKTLVLDPETLAVTATFSGAVVDVVVDGTRAFALLEGPSEVRRFDIADPLHPALAVSGTAPSGATSIAFANDRVYLLAGRVAGLSPTTLAQVEERLTNVATRTPHRLRIEGNCAVVSRDGEAPVLYSLPSWTPAAALLLPSNIRAFAVQPGLLLFLTDHSLELMSSSAPEKTRRRAAGR